MSHEFRLACKTCNLETEEVNHAQESIKNFLSKWEENKNALTKVLDLGLFDIGDVRESFRSKSLPVDIYEFMLLHENHELVIRSEYTSVADEVIKAKVKKALIFKLEEEFNNLFTVKENGYGYIKLKTPFTLPDGAIIDVYLKLNKDGDVEHITDLGCTLGWVYVNCHEEDRSADFWERVKDFDVGFIGETLITKPSSNTGLVQEVFKLITATIRVSNFI